MAWWDKIFGNSPQIKKSDYDDCLEYIENYWDQLKCRVSYDTGIHLGLPYSFIAPNKGIFNNNQFYWDTYFTILGLIDAERIILAKGMVENLIHLYRKYGIIPSRNCFYNLGISQIPFLSSMILEVFHAKGNKMWLRRAVLVAEEELHHFWMDEPRSKSFSDELYLEIYEKIPLASVLHSLRNLPRPHASTFLDVVSYTKEKMYIKDIDRLLKETFLSKDPFFFSKIIGNKEKRKVAEAQIVSRKAERHLVYKGLSRYCDHHITHVTAEHESGWDMTSRFYNHALNYLPVDLNCCLYKYEKDLEYIWNILGEKEKARRFGRAAAERRKNIISLMWNPKKGFFFDYDYVHGEQSNFWSLAGFYPLWTGLATQKQAKMMRKRLKIFECKGGLANTQKENLSSEYKQWDYPNGWPNQHWIVVKGLINYGYKEDAFRITKKWLDLNKAVFNKTGKFWEKYDVVNYDIGKSAPYETQSGFGWTNAIFLKMVNELEE